ncbi:MAG: RNA polymerase sigma factor SigZ [Bacteroidales bacterium]|jgi:RNA polymerase sigma-70 factor (ECF subfamily)|nr:RNA polymerase sigma factor SigZ [Bacteroidales bacterium]
MEEIWLKFENKLRAFILSKVHDKYVADDLLQEVFIRIHANMDKVNDRTKLQSWIFQICRNIIVDHYRSHQKEQKSKSLAFEGEYEETATDFMSEALEDMIKMMSDLPPEYCKALCLTELEGLSQKDYADKIGISYSGAKSRVQRARKMLKDLLMNCCHYEFDKYGTVIGIYPAHCCCCCPK